MPNALALLQDYIEAFRKQRPRKGNVIAGQKRKSPDDEAGEHQLHLNTAAINRLTNEFRLPSESSRSSPGSDLSRDSLSAEDDQDCYNCKLIVKDERITMKPVCPASRIMNTTNLPSTLAHTIQIPNQSPIPRHFPTPSMLARAQKAPTQVADQAVRIEFSRVLSRLPGPSITHVNTRDSSTPSLNFCFVDHYVYGVGVEPPDPEQMIGCSTCKPNMGGFCGCEYTKRCECLEYAHVDESKLDEDEKKRYEEVMQKGLPTMGFPKNFPYSKETGHMVRQYLTKRYPIYECNDRCGCGDVCKTRVVQRGRQVKLEIFKTKDRGWGLRAKEKLHSGQFVDVYRGEVITNDEADHREAEGEKNKENYLFSLDKFHDIVDPIYVVDGEFMGGPTRFINHSCDPNCAQYSVCYDRNNPYIYDIAIFAIRDIPKDEELTFNYTDVDDDEQSQEMEKNLKEAKIEKDSMPCRCGAKNCRGWLWK